MAFWTHLPRERPLWAFALLALSLLSLCGALPAVVTVVTGPESFLAALSLACSSSAPQHSRLELRRPISLSTRAAAAYSLPFRLKGSLELFGGGSLAPGKPCVSAARLPLLAHLTLLRLRLVPTVLRSVCSWRTFGAAVPRQCSAAHIHQRRFDVDAAQPEHKRCDPMCFTLPSPWPKLRVRSCTGTEHAAGLLRLPSRLCRHR